MTQDQLGELMDTDRANIGKYENGMRCEMSYKMIRRFARALGIPASMLVGKDDDLGEILVTAASLNEENRSVALTTSKSSPVYADGNRPTSGCLNVLKHPNTAEESGQNRKRVKDDSPQPKTGQIVREKKDGPSIIVTAGGRNVLPHRVISPGRSTLPIGSMFLPAEKPCTLKIE